MSIAHNPSPTSTTSSLSSSVRFGLNERNTSQILVFTRYGGIHYSSEQELCKTLDKGELHTIFPGLTVWSKTNPNTDLTLRCSKISIPWGNSVVEVHQEDTLPEPDRQQFADLPNMKLSLASISLPPTVRWKRLIGKFKELYIVSPGSTPSNSTQHSQATASRIGTLESSTRAP
jgi:hypothetical protein